MRRGRFRDSGAFPYWRSVLIVTSQIAALILFWASIADPRTGEFAHPLAAGLAFLAVRLTLPLIFYVDYRTQSKGRAERRRGGRRMDAADPARFGPARADVARH